VLSRHVQAIKQVPSKSTGTDRCLQVSIGRGNHAHVRVNQSGSSNSGESDCGDCNAVRDLAQRIGFEPAVAFFQHTFPLCLVKASTHPVCPLVCTC
jgi:hypothetical protein